MITVLVVTAVAVVVAVVGVAAGPRRGRQMSGQVPPIALAGELQDRVRALLADDRLVQAVKEVRQATGLGLVQAKQLVDAVQDGRLPEPGPYRSSQGSESLADRARRMRDGGDVPGAVALVQAETGMTREDAERFVAALG
ncbi:ribosomal protein L7/L12 [Actinoallomurus rhizosphaericola]|uniref:ribosomal protein L7/L12 n=1 Tax=Actinoallomurus rhizosphaericola TaxID=2952536 RepID=UPI002090B081|nr:ribosomal protein L7/L12 [Actinoallomurus rhizosphaericola]MCO5994042.1 ribosomal protein L7/L12 [Actinoallomurus rhizosphaericola]